MLKLIGDGVRAIFRADDPAEACRGALRAEADLRARVQALNARRAADGRPVTSVYLGLHIGDVFYGNIGSVDRLDFTVVGPAVNETKPDRHDVPVGRPRRRVVIGFRGGNP